MPTATAVDDPPADDLVIELRTCKVCGETKPLHLFAKTACARDGSPRFQHKCNVCRNVEAAHRRETGDTPSSSTERQRRAKVREAYGHAFVEGAPDPGILRLLAELLREDRDRWGYTFREAWDQDVAFVLDRLSGPRSRVAREQWLEALKGTRSAWQAAWGNEPGPGSQLAPALADEPSSERVSAQLVA